jgi:hypothetical protein
MSVDSIKLNKKGLNGAAQPALPTSSSFRHYDDLKAGKVRWSEAKK